MDLALAICHGNANPGGEKGEPDVQGNQDVPGNTEAPPRAQGHAAAPGVAGGEVPTDAGYEARRSHCGTVDQASVDAHNALTPWGSLPPVRASSSFKAFRNRMLPPEGDRREVSGNGSTRWTQ